MRISKQDLIEQIMEANIRAADDKGADYDDECQSDDREYFEELTLCDLERELEMARLGTQFDE